METVLLPVKIAAVIGKIKNRHIAKIENGVAGDKILSRHDAQAPGAHAKARFFHIIGRHEGIGRAIDIVGPVPTQPRAGGKEGGAASAEFLGVDFPGEEVVLKTFAAPDLIFKLQADGAVGVHFVSFQVQLPAVRSQNGPTVTNDEIVGDVRNPADPIELNSISGARNERFNFKGLILGFLGSRQ